VVASIDLAVEGHRDIAQEWSDPKGSRGEGMVLLPGGHLLVAKEKQPAAFIEFGPPHRGRAAWPAVPRSRTESGGRLGSPPVHCSRDLLPDKTLPKTCADFSDTQ
jgi:hypothetical protein